MKFKVFTCVDGDYCSEPITGEVKECVLWINGRSIEFELITLPAVSGHSAGKFNILFKDTCEALGSDQNDDRKYFVSASPFQIFRLKWMFGKYWIQKTDNLMKIIVPLIVGVIMFIFGRYTAK